MCWHESLAAGVVLADTGINFECRQQARGKRTEIVVHSDHRLVGTESRDRGYPGGRRVRAVPGDSIAPHSTS